MPKGRKRRVALITDPPAGKASWEMTPAEVASIAACFDAPSEAEPTPLIAETLTEVC
jgi:hypothetical protein